VDVVPSAPQHRIENVGQRDSVFHRNPIQRGHVSWGRLTFRRLQRMIRTVKNDPWNFGVIGSLENSNAEYATSWKFLNHMQPRNYVKIFTESANPH
jgi:hypothetical protein